MIERGKIDNPGEWMRVYKTDFKYAETNPWWDTDQLTLTEFCNNNKTCPVRFTVKSHLNYGEHPTYGEVITTTRDIEMSPDHRLEITDAKGHKTGTIQFNRFELDMRKGLQQYLEDWRMEVHVGIDFTLSNLEITDFRSLHRQGDTGEMNQYEKAIFEVCNVMMSYARKKKFYTYGFGAKPLYQGIDQIQKCWNLSKETPDGRV